MKENIEVKAENRKFREVIKKQGIRIDLLERYIRKGRMVMHGTEEPSNER